MVSGLDGSGLVLRNNGGDDLPIGANGAFVDDAYADDHNLTVGSPITLETPTGEELKLQVEGIFPEGGGHRRGRRRGSCCSS